MIPTSSPQGVPRSALIQKVTSALVDNVWQLTCVGGALFAFYEDRVLCACGLAGFAGLVCSVLGLEAAGLAPTRGDRLWGIVIPVCSALAVATSVGCRLLGLTATRQLAPWLACFGLFLTAAGFATVAVRGDKDARLRQ
eukprot:CAMPEP_0168434696 /NCGR_PEP_ID=MMETSP0228-20121227/40037_1 /TAXON_ID=133427 /ORGANISM="Protoceratium reticulatum, Strain CCCM 535 (=CCMP 1889)" /LENGTH=138 /DNA_ID=CAMNT_0008448857 /DNA_START=41 /DNA_END=454 /DNA_ORIENTATION=+